MWHLRSEEQLPLEPSWQAAGAAGRVGMKAHLPPAQTPGWLAGWLYTRLNPTIRWRHERVPHRILGEVEHGEDVGACRARGGTGHVAGVKACRVF